MEISFHPAPDPDDRKSIRAMLPWWKRFGAFVADVKVFIGICAATLAAHAWIKGLVTRTEVDVAVEAAVIKATAQIRGDLETIKTNTGGLPEWRGETSKKIVAIEKDVAAVTKDATKANDRIDAYLDKRGHTR
jgi:hypothetical protein